MGMITTYRRSYAAVTVSGTTPINFTFAGAMDFLHVGVQMITTSTAAGAWTVQASNNFQQNNLDGTASAGTWDDVTSLFNAAPTAVTTASDQYRQLTNYAGGALRFVFTPSSGAGAASLILTAKGT